MRASEFVGVQVFKLSIIVLNPKQYPCAHDKRLRVAIVDYDIPYLNSIQACLSSSAIWCD